MSRVMSAPRMPQLVLNAQRQQARPWWETPAKAAILILSAVALVASLRSGAFFHSFYGFSEKLLYKSFFWTATIYGVICYAALAWRIILWRRYRPMESVPNAKLPTVTVIIPAFNEGALVRQSIRSVAAIRYPTEKLQIIVIDDGSSAET